MNVSVVIFCVATHKKINQITNVKRVVVLCKQLEWNSFNKRASNLYLVLLLSPYSYSDGRKDSYIARSQLILLWGC